MMEDTPSLLDVQNVTFGHGQTPLFRKVTFDVPAGCFAVLLGPNGAGKSTLLRCIAGLQTGWRGAIHLEGRDLSALSRRQTAQVLAFVSQEVQADLPLTVRELVSLGRAPRQGTLGLSSAADRACIEAALDEVALTPLANRALSEVSGGERRLAFLARALAQEPKLLLLDEPTAFFDLGNQARFLSLVARLARRGLGILAVLHDPNLASGFADRIVTLSRRGLCEAGAARAMLSRERLEALYETALDTFAGKAGAPHFGLRTLAQSGPD